MGKLYDLIQEHIDAQTYPPKPAKVAEQLGVSQTTLTNWRDPKGLIEKKHLLAIAEVTRNPFSVVRDAFLADINLLHAGPTERPPRGDGEVGGDVRPAAM